MVGLNTKSFRGVIAAIMLILIFTAFCGCIQITNIQNVFKPKPTITPIVTITPTPKPPTPTPEPSPVARQMNTAVKVMPFGEKGLVSFGFVKDTEIQRENVTVVIANDGSVDAKNVVLTLTITDAHGGNAVVQQKYRVGDLRKGDRKECNLVTEDHELASSVLIDVNVEWGENSEFYNPTTFIHVAKSIWM
jgi:hypothetical protein